MKKILYSSILIAAILAGCNDQLDQVPVSSTTTTNFYTSTNDFIQAVNGVYASLKTYPDQLLWLGEIRSDNITANSDGNRDWQYIREFSPNLTTTTAIVNAWRTNFNAIYNANAVLDALTTKGTIIADDATRSRLTGEVRFLRSFYYFQLLRLFGKVPVIDRPLTASEVTTVPQSSIAGIYEFIIADLTYAAENLPASYTGTDLGRVTKYAAKSLLGLVYITRSGPAYEGVDGPGLGTNDYEKALALFEEVITSGQFTFADTYSSIFSYAAENNKEVVFDIQYATGINGASFPSQLVPVAYWTSLKLSNAYGNAQGASNFPVSNNVLASYAAQGTDLRNAFTVERTYTSPFVKKYLDLSKKGTTGTDWPINFIVLRYTDVLLMKAECILNGATGTQETVDALVNQVRVRAGLNAITQVDKATLLEERRREFLGEGIRWNDLVRSGQAVTIINNWVAADGLTNIAEMIPLYVVYPIPAVELQTRTGLYTQNPGYF